MNKLLYFSLLISLSAFAADTISIVVVGDIMLGTTYPTSMLPENQGKDLFTPVKPWLNSAHIRFGNLEGTLFDGKPQLDGKTPGKNRFLFKSPTNYSYLLKEAGFNVMSLANNHVKDFGQMGMASTKSALKKVSIQFSSKFGEVAEFKVGPTDIALIAADFYRAPRSITEMDDTILEIKQLKDSNKLVIVSAHVGGEGIGAEYVKAAPELYLGENRGNSIQFAKAAIDAGADLIVMHGPHVPRAIDKYKDRLIIYSLGNFITGKGISLDGLAKVAPLIRLEMSHRGYFISGQIVPFIQMRDPQRIELDPDLTAIRLIKKLSEKQFINSAPKIEDNGLFQ